MNPYYKYQTLKHTFITRAAKMLSDLREAVSGTEQDFTTGKLGRAVFLLSIPMALEMLMESVFAIVDIFFVSKLGPEAIATVGLTESIITIVYALAVGLSTATSSLISRRIGEKNLEGASTAAFQAILTGILISLFIAVPGVIFAKKLLLLMGASAVIVQEMWGFAAIMIGSNTVIMLLFIINAIFRSAGDAAVSMRVLWMANLINIVLDPLLIFGWGPLPAFGVQGAAMATATGRGLAVLFQVYLLFRGKKRVQIHLRHIRIEWPVMMSLLKLALGGVSQHIIATSSWIILIRIISVFGSIVVAGYTIAIRVVNFALLPSWGLSNAASTLVGQNLGARQPQRAERSVWITGWINILFLGSIGMILLVFSDSFIRFFIQDPAVIAAGSVSLRIISIGFIAYGFGMVLVNALNGAGDTFSPMLINIACYWILEIPLAWLLAVHAGLNESGVFIAIVIAETMMTLSAFWIFRKGNWKQKKV